MIKPKKVTKADYVIKDSTEFATNHKLFIWLGYLYDGSFISKCRVFVFVFFTYSAPIHHILPVFLDKSCTTMMKLLLFYIIQYYILLCFSWPSMIYNSNEVINLGRRVRRGFFRYSEEFSKEERLILSQTNDSIVKTTRISLPVYALVGVLTFLKEFSYESIEQHRLMYPGWFPWNADTNFKYACTFIYHLFLLMNTILALEANFLLFYYFTAHYEGQFNLLIKHYKDTFPIGLPSSVAWDPECKLYTLRRLKDCIQHHCAIKEYYHLILKYFGLTMFFLRIVSAVMLCIMCYIISKGVRLNQLSQLIGFLAAQLILLIFCLRGEKVATVSELWTKTVFEVDWWRHPVEVQKTVLMMQIGASRTLKTYGLWRVVKLSHEGLALIGQESLAFFNMLKAVA